MKKVLIVSSIIVVLIGLTALTLRPAEVLAGKGLPFGGRIGFVMPCINGLFIVVISADPKSVGPYIITPITLPHANYMPFIGNAIKGTYIPGIPCFLPPAIVVPTKGAISEFGTSLVPGI